MNWQIVFTRQAAKDYETAVKSPHRAKIGRLLSVLEEDPFAPPYEKLVDRENVYSRRINVQHRLVYEVLEKEGTIKVLRMWTHYE